MWRELSPREKEAVKKARSPFSKAISFIEIVLLLFPIGFGISNLINLISERNNSAAIELAVDLFIAALIILITPRIKKLFTEDVDKGHLQICEVVIDELLTDTIDAQVINSVHKEDKIAYYAIVHAEDDAEKKYKVKIDVEMHGSQKAGNRLMLIRFKDDECSTDMMLLEVK